MVRKVVTALEEQGLVAYFRIGQSMHQIIFSTLDHHRLQSEPRVTLEFNQEDQNARVAYSSAHLHFSEPISEQRVPRDAALPTTLGYLLRLWMETKPATPIPAALASA